MTPSVPSEPERPQQPPAAAAPRARWCSREEFFAMVEGQARQGQRTIVALDGYPASGKTTLAMALARIPGVAWVPLDYYRAGVGIDVRRLHRETIKPFLKRGRVPDLTHIRGAVMAHQQQRSKGGRIQGVTLLIVEGQGSTAHLDEMQADYLCWVDCDRLARLERVEARAKPALQELRDSIEFAETSGRREEAIALANFVVDSS